jgi:hypothetical protein
LGDSPARGQGRLHFAQLNPEPADLDLVIGTAYELQISIHPCPDDVSGPVHPVTAAAERIRQETPRGQGRLAQVPSGDLRAS